MQGLRHPSKALTSVALLMGLALLAGALLVGSALAIHDEEFELDGNVAVDAGGPSHDWVEVCKDAGLAACAAFGTSGANPVAFVQDYNPTADDQPATGGTKADLDVSSWDCKTAVMSPPKNDIANAFAAKYGDHLYFGLDRINSDNGDATVGFWFFKDTHTCNAAVAGSHFTGNHQVGDLLIDSAFTGGGGVSTIKVYTWCTDMSAVTPDFKCGDQDSTTVPPAGTGDGPLQLVASGNDCRPTPSNDAVCATVNIEADPDVDPPWPYVSGCTGNCNHAIYENGALFEGGLDLGEIGLDIGCGGTFLAYTRASQSVTAQMHDFAIGQFQLCDARIKIEASATNQVGTNHVFTVTAEKKGPNDAGFVAAAGVCVTATLTNSNGATSTFVAEGTNCNGDAGGLTGDDCLTGAAGTCTITITSPTTGQTVVNASANIVIEGESFLRDTDPATATPSGCTPTPCGPVTKTWVDARISIQTSDTNEVNQSHTFTVTVQKDLGDGAGFVAAAGVTITPSETGVGSITGGTCTGGGVTNASGQCTIIVNSAAAGQSTVNASATVNVGGVNVNVATNGYGAFNISNVKTWVNAKISITPLTDLNPVGTNHVLTCHIDVNPGTGWVNAPAGTNCDADIISGPGSFVGGIDSCLTVAATGSCTVTITSNVTGTTVIRACTEEDQASPGLTVGGVLLTRCTAAAAVEVEPGQSNGVDARKTWGDAWITINPPTDNNVVNTNHVLTVAVLKNIGSGVEASVGTCVTASIVSGPGSFVNDPADLDTNGCNDANGNGDDCITGATGTCTITITSALSGTTVVHAAADIVIDGGSVHRETDGVAPNSGNASKTWVNAKISLTPGGTNFIHSNHPMTCHVEKNEGSGFVAASGVTCDGNIDSGPGSFVGGDTCVTNASGDCTLTIVSAITGTTVVSACTSGMTVSGQAITRCTDGAVVETGNSNSGTVTKIWISKEIRLTKTFQIGPFTTIVGKTACFSLTRDTAPPPPISSDTDADANAANGVTLCHTFVAGDNGSFTYIWHNVVAGTHSITETTTPAGYTTMAPITNIVVSAATPSPITFTRNDPLQPGDLRLRKLLGPAPGTTWNGPNVTIYVCANSPAGSNVEQPLADCDSAGEAEAVVVLTAAASTATVTNLAEGYYTVCEFPVPAGYTIPAADQCVVAQVVAGVTGGTAFQVTFINSPPSEGCTPGFWQGGVGVTMWNTFPNDPQWTANGASGTNPFATTTIFNTFFTGHPSVNGQTMLAIVGSGGGSDLVVKTARVLIASYLNSSAGLNNGYTTAQLITLWNAFIAGGGTDSSLFTALAASTQLGCPLPR